MLQHTAMKLCDVFLINRHFASVKSWCGRFRRIYLRKISQEAINIILHFWSVLQRHLSLFFRKGEGVFRVSCSAKS